MISFKELAGSYNVNDIPHSHQINGDELLRRVNKIRAKWGKPMKVTSGYRSVQDQLRIYSEKAAKAGVPFDASKVPMRSQHLKMAAIDIYDPNLEITKWLKDNPEILEEANLFCEDGNSNWVHLQLFPFGSYKPGGTRWFKP